MLRIMTVQIKKNEKGILLRNGSFERVLASGTHRLFSGFDSLRVETFALEQAAFAHSLADYLLTREPEVMAEHFVRVELAEHEAGLRSENGVLVEILPPATRRLYWKGLAEVDVDIVDLRAGAALPPALVARLAQSALRARPMAGLAGVALVEVPESACAVLTVDGQLQPLLPPGTHGFWKFGRALKHEIVELRLQAMEVSGQDIMTRDKVGLRVNLNAAWRYTDVLLAHRQLPKPAEHLYRELQFALRAAVGTRTLDELLENKTAIDETVGTHMAARLPAYGLQLESVGVKDIVLPGDMKAILTQVVQAEKQAQANVIRRREETAATRSLLNTAKVMEDNPVALRMKELETLERVAERIDKISVFGGLDQVLNGLVKMR
ncbi:slipin family protein [Comamonas humi]